MCGICGVFEYRTGQGVEASLIRDMCQRIRHRGPDDDGMFFEDGLGMGMRRLSIIDLAGGSQPMTNETGTVWLIFNGEIYNYCDLRSRLTGLGHEFATRSDTEVIVHAYEQWGLDGFAKLNGMYGLALYDRGKQRLVIVRDPLGVKPLYFHDTGSSIAFGSEIRALRCLPWVPWEVDPAGVDEFLAYRFIPAPRTGLRGIRKLRPGQGLAVDRRGAFSFEVAQPTADPPVHQSERDLAELVDASLFQAVERQMVADVPIGLMLSGGIDSTVVGAMMAASSGRPIETFTVGVAGDQRTSELAKARVVAAALGTNHHEIELTTDQLEDAFACTVRVLEEPIAIPSAIAFLALCGLAAEHVKVALTGQGSDEPFAGYPRYAVERYGALYRLAPMPVRRHIIEPLAELADTTEKPRRAAASLGLADPAERFAEMNCIIDADTRRALSTHGRATVTDVAMAFRTWQTPVRHRDTMSQLQYADARIMLPDALLMYGDKASMARGLEVRVPFLDHELLALAESLPARYKVRRMERKYLLRRAIAKWLPPGVLHAIKVPFTIPLDDWLYADGCKALRLLLQDDSSLSHDYLDPATVERLISLQADGHGDYRQVLFSLATLEMWLREVVNGPPDASVEC